MNTEKHSPLVVAGYEVYSLVTDRFRLDGGAMFGSIPKTLWSKMIPGDEANRIQLCCRCLVLRSADRLILVDTGMGRKWTEKQRSIFAVENILNLEAPESVFGKEPVTDVVLTHLHFDHGGGLTKMNSAGELELCFPAANHFLQVDNWERANAPGPREKAAYLSENVAPLKTGKLTLTTDSEEILPGVRVFCYRGHTAGMQGLLIGDGPGAIWYPADLIPTAHHIGLPYIMGYDLCAEKTLSEKSQFLGRAADEGWWTVFEHDVDTPMVKIERHDQKGFLAGSAGQLPEWGAPR